MGNNFITPLSRKIRIYLLLWSCFFVLLSMVMQKFYRPFIYANNIFDFHIADSYSNLCCVPASVCLFFAIDGKVEYRMLFYGIISFVSWILYEIFFSLTFDYNDIIASFISAIITFFLLNKFLLNK